MWLYCFLVFADYANHQIWKEKCLNGAGCWSPVLIYCSFLNRHNNWFFKAKGPEFSNPIKIHGFQSAYSSFGELILKCISKVDHNNKSIFCVQSWSQDAKTPYNAQPLFCPRKMPFMFTFQFFNVTFFGAWLKWHEEVSALDFLLELSVTTWQPMLLLFQAQTCSLW